MARPNKQGLDYFPLDTEWNDDLYFILGRYQIKGVGMLISLWQEIYKQGYYIFFSERKLAIICAKKNIDLNEFRNFIIDCINEDIFDKGLFEKYGILTSRGIQKRYLRAVDRRNEVEVFREFMLIEINSYKNVIYSRNNLINVNNGDTETLASNIGKEIKKEDFFGNEAIEKRKAFLMQQAKDLGG